MIISRFSAVSSTVWCAALCIVLSMMGETLSAQTCFAGYTQRDTLTFEVPLGACSVSSDEILSRLGLQGCTHASLSVRQVAVNSTRTIDVYNENTQTIVDVIVVKTTVVPAQLPSVIRLQFGTNDCSFSKDTLLNQLNVVAAPSIRSNIHFISGTSRLTRFPYGDTIRIDRVVCGEGYTYARDIQLIIEPTVARLQGNVIVYNAGFTTQKISIGQILNSYPYFHYNCDIDRYTIENKGPFGYGRHRIGDIYMDNALIAKDLEVVVNSGSCPTNLRDLVLEEGQCYLNKADILDTLGFDKNRDDYGRVRLTLAPRQSLEDEIFTVTGVSVDGYTVCSDNIFVNYQQRTVIANESTLACNDELNISLDAECQVMLNSHILLENGDYCYLNYVVTAVDESGSVVAQGHTIVLDRAGRYKVTIRNPKSGANCTSTINIEDKHIIDVTCAPDTVQCHYGLAPKADGTGPAFPYVGLPSTYSPTGIPQRYTLENNKTCAIKYAQYVDVEERKCVGEFKEVIRRIWTFSDFAGNEDTCHQLLYVLKTPFDSVDQFEPFYAECIEDFEKLDDNGYPSPAETGYPTISGGRYNANTCNTLRMSYTDSKFDLCGRSVKLIREWLIHDWCSNRVTHRTQVIYIEDKTAPKLTDTLTDLHLDSHPFICGAENVELPSPKYTDCGSNTVSIQVEYEVFKNNIRSVESNGNSLTIPSVKFEGMDGSFEVYYILTDECGNVARDTITVYMVDNQPPVAVCDQNTAISIAGGGEAQVKALTFDDISVDNCGIAKYEARKLNGECYVDTAFSELLLFCCDEVGQKIDVEFRVTDLAGNTNTCRVSVEVFDKFRPIISCPAPLTIDCGVDYTDLDITGRPNAIDNCSIDSLYYIDDVRINDCGHGQVRRRWIARDRANQTVECEQIITVQSADPFVMTPDRYPRDTTIVGCLASVTPDNTGRPDVSGASECSDVLVTFKDTPFYDVNGACFKIIREWIIIDWCQYSTSSGSDVGKWTKPQAIKVKNTIAPTFVHLPADTTICSYGVTCEDEVSFTAVAEDECSPADQLEWKYELYRSSDDVRMKVGKTARVSAFLSKGKYYIKYTVSDGCGNATNQTVNITVTDCRAPVVTCSDAIIGAILNSSGTASIHIDDISVRATDNCTPSRDIYFSFSDTARVVTRDFSCADVPNGKSEDHIVPIYATDADGNTAKCQVIIQVTDGPDDVCPDTNEPVEEETLMIAGVIQTDISAPVDNVSVYITAPNGQTKLYTTTTNGKFAFSELDKHGDYTVSFVRDTRADEGLSVSDLILIKRYTLGLSSFSSAYQVVAADLNNDGRISGSDVAKLQRLLLFRDTHFDRGQKSWRFVRTDHTFTNIHDPFPYPETITIRDIKANQMQSNMMGVKIGDVNGSNSVNASYRAGTRSANGLNWVMTDRQVDAGTSVEIPIYTRHAESIYGFDLNATVIDARLEIRSGSLDISDEDYVSDNQGVRVVWAETELHGVGTEQPLFYLTIHNVGRARNVSDIVNEMELTTVAHDMMDASGVLTFEQSYSSGSITIDQITPVPFIDYTRISLSSTSVQEMLLSIYTIDGQLLYNRVQTLHTGENSITIDATDIQDQHGVLVVRAKTASQTITRRIVRVE